MPGIGQGLSHAEATTKAACGTMLQVIMLSGREHAYVSPSSPEGLGEIALDTALKQAIDQTRLVAEVDLAPAPGQRRRP